ncbi:pentatricopeptide repeat-containing protein At1g08070, chloroplastic-like [Chenopodium quinoa]|nr:pentatricopeptide repeat-containing protein At1g08070, chloroplastic-like [Chenopodium quinoa]
MGIGEIALAVVQKPLHILLEQKFISLLQSCKTINHFHQIQAQVFVNGLEYSYYVVPKIIAQSAVLKHASYARQLFDKMPEPDDVFYNVMFKGYSQNGMHNEVISLFGKMMESCVKPSCYTFPMVLKSCGKLSALCEGEQVHSVVLKNGFKRNPFVGNTLIEMYSGSGEFRRAFKVFEEIPLRNVVGWTNMISGFILCGDMKLAKELFDLAVDRDVVLWNTMISGYIDAGDMENAHKLFDVMPRKDTMMWNTMLNGYANSGNVDACEELFEVMPKRNVFSWNGLIGVYANHGCFVEVLTTFNRMLSEAEVLPNHVTLATVLSACARLGALDLGMWVHVYAQRIGYKEHVSVENALMDMYAKCGRIEIAKAVFNGLVKRDLVSWNTIIGGLAMHGHASDALALFHEMKNAGVQPDGVTFVGVLCACTHIGYIDEGLAYFQSLADYSLSPQIEHYGCLVDLYSRSGHLIEALNLVKMMPMKADSVIWSCLLGASRVYKNMEIAKLALEHLIELEPRNPSNYLTSSNIYGDAGKWDYVSELKVAMRDTRFQKKPGYSMIEIHDKAVEFYSSDHRHPEMVEIYVCLRNLSKIIQSLGFQPEDMDLE